MVGNAYFGKNGKSPSGNSVHFGTHEETGGGAQQINATFRAYESYDEAAEDYAQMVTANKAFAGALPYRKEPEKFIAEIAKRYATDHKYTSAVLSIMKPIISSNMTPNRYSARRLPIAALVFVSIAHADPCPIPRHPVASAGEAVELSKRAIVAYKLTDTPLRCLAVAPSPGYTGAGFEIDVRENHLEGCGEALPMFDPLVMSILVTPAGTVTTTAGATDAQQTYRRPSCPRPPRPGDKTRD